MNHSGLYPIVVVGTDGSPTACAAVGQTALLARAMRVPLLIATAFLRQRAEELVPPGELGIRAEHVAGLSYRTATDIAADGAALARRVAPGLEVDTASPEGNPGEVLLDLAAARPGSLLAVGSIGMTGSRRFLLGSIPNKISHHAPGDLLVVATEDAREPAPYRRILVGTDGSKTATRAVDHAIALAAALEARLTVLTVATDAAHGRAVVDEAAARAAQAGVDCQPEVRAGDPADQIVAAGEDHDLLVVGSKGMTGATRFLLGSVPNKVSHHAGRDLLIVKTA